MSRLRRTYGQYATINGITKLNRLCFILWKTFNFKKMFDYYPERLWFVMPTIRSVRGKKRRVKFDSDRGAHQKHAKEHWTRARIKDDKRATISILLLFNSKRVCICFGINGWLLNKQIHISIVFERNERFFNFFYFIICIQNSECIQPFILIALNNRLSCALSALRLIW